jgi:IS30 family transposase
VVTVVERKSGLTRIGKLPTASGKDTLERTTEILPREPHPIRTITADNGTEFHIYKEREVRLGAQVFFATPHHSFSYFCLTSELSDTCAWRRACESRICDKRSRSL